MSTHYDPTMVSLTGLLALEGLAQALKFDYGRLRASAETGETRGHFLGMGMDFAEVRGYHPGDDIRHMDWRVMARTGEPHTKLYEEERKRPVYFFVDFRKTMRFATRRCFKSVLAAKFAAVVGWRALQCGDKVGGFILSDNDFETVKLSAKKSDFTQFLKQLSTQSELPADAGVAYNKTSALQTIEQSIKPGSLLFFLSDCYEIEPADLQQCARRARVSVMHICDEIEVTPPVPGQYGMAEGAKRLRMDTRSDALRSAYRQHTQQHLAAVQQTCWQYHMAYQRLLTKTPLAEILASHFLVGR